MSKRFIDYAKESELVIGFLDSESFCGKFKLKTPLGNYLEKQGAFKVIHEFQRHNLTVDFTMYLKD